MIHKCTCPNGPILQPATLCEICMGVSIPKGAWLPVIIYLYQGDEYPAPFMEDCYDLDYFDSLEKYFTDIEFAA